MRDRQHHLSVLLSADEMAQLHELAEHRDEPASYIIRRFIRAAHAAEIKKVRRASVTNK